MTNVSAGPVRTRSLALRLAFCLAWIAATVVPSLAAVPARGTEILWDRYGIPHIMASDHPSLFYAYGYAQMEAHSELLLRLYTQARGRGAAKRNLTVESANRAGIDGEIGRAARRDGRALCR